MLRQKHNLPDVRGIVRDLPVDGLQHGVRLAADGHGAHHIFRLERVDRAQHASPAFFPPLHDVGARGRGGHFKFAIAKAVRLLAVAW